MKSYKNALVYPQYGGEVLERFSLSEASLLGAGMHSRVYAIDAANILRLYSPEIDSAHVESIYNFHDGLNANEVDFTVPVITEFGVCKDIVYSIERNLGVSMGAALNFSSEDNKTRFVQPYCDVVGEIKSLTIREKGFYGELMGSDPIRRNSWSQFLLDCAEKKIESSIVELRENVNDFDSLYQRWIKEIKLLPNPEPVLVHGDIFPGNLMVDDSGDLSSVIDFSSMSFIGDWRFDVVIASIHICFSDFTLEQMRTIQKKLDELYDIDKHVFDLYAVFNLMYFSPDHRPLQKQWCYENINQIAASNPMFKN